MNAELQTQNVLILELLDSEKLSADSLFVGIAIEARATFCEVNNTVDRVAASQGEGLDYLDRPLIDL